MLEDFERFTKKGKSFLPRVSIRKRGQIGFNNGSIQKFELDRFDYAVMFMSKDKNRIAVMFTNNEKEPGAIKIMKRQGNFSFSGKPFFDYYGVDYSRTRNFDLDWIGDENTAVFSLSE